MSEYDSLLARIETREAVVGIVGLGYVGLPLAMAFVDGGFRVLGVDIEPRVVKGVEAGESHVGDVPSGTLARAIDRGFLTATADFARLAEADAVVPTAWFPQPPDTGQGSEEEGGPGRRRPDIAAFLTTWHM